MEADFIFGLAIHIHRDHHFPLIREFYGVSQKIDYNLSQPARIPLQRHGGLSCNAAGQFKPFLVGQKGQVFDHIFQVVGKIEIDDFKMEHVPFHL